MDSIDFSGLFWVGLAAGAASLLVLFGIGYVVVHYILPHLHWA
jgi:hypothetical protein